MLILLAEDDKRLAERLQRCLEAEKHVVDVAREARSSLRAALEHRYEAIILSVSLPGGSGLNVVRGVREASPDTLIVLTTASDEPREVVNALDAGADDCFVKPFSFDVLLARLRARGRMSDPGARLSYQDLVLDIGRQEAWRGKRFLRLTRTEFAILECLMQSIGHATSRHTLISKVWGANREVGENSLYVFMRLLRSKVDTPENPPLIHTLRGVGYTIRHLR